ncbi:MAG TPA: hypothetical protein VJ345_04340 [Anaerolineales bacterium]|nr:hypothetical protein [Anaerolineales bacterium]
MNMSKWMKWLIGGVAGLFLAAVGLGLGTAIAVAATAGESPAVELADAGLDTLGWPHGLVDMQALLADELGITVEELAAAQQAAREAAVQQLVEAGVLTEEQGELAAAAAALRSYVNRHDLVAEALGMTPEALTQARLDGKTLAEILDDQGLSLSEYQENLAQIREEALDQAVSDGVITQDQLDQLQERIQDGFGRGQGAFGGFGPGHRMGGFGPADR